MNKVNALSENKQAFLIVLIYAICCKFFKCAYLQFIPKYDSIFAVVSMCVSIYLIKYVFRQYRNRDFSHEVSKLTILFYFTLVVGFLFHGQIGYYPLRQICIYTGPMMILIFFILKKWNITIRVLLKSVCFSCILYGLAYIIGTITFPNQFFGFDLLEEKQEQIMNSSESRGVLRLFIFGSQIIPLSIFMVLTYFNRRKKYYILLIPLFILLLMQGARTPFFICFLISIIYIVYQMKNRIVVLFLAVSIYVSGTMIYNYLLTSTSTDALTMYIQMTQDQVQNNNNDNDIRVEMSKYMLFDFNKTNLLQMIFGNGYPDEKNSSYTMELKRLSSVRHFYTDDVGLVQIFVYMGIIGWVVYFFVFYRGIKTKVPDQYAFGRLFLFHYLFISFANNAMVKYGVFTFGLALYSIYKANYDMKNGQLFVTNE